MVPRVAITVRLDPDVAYWINRQPMSQAKAVETLVSMARDLHNARFWKAMGGNP